MLSLDPLYLTYSSFIEWGLPPRYEDFELDSRLTYEKCILLLLEAGADPTVVTDHKDNTCFLTESLEYEMVIIKFKPRNDIADA